MNVVNIDGEEYKYNNKLYMEVLEGALYMYSEL